jgi:hypothetical protein
MTASSAGRNRLFSQVRRGRTGYGHSSGCLSSVVRISLASNRQTPWSAARTGRIPERHRDQHVRRTAGSLRSPALGARKAGVPRIGRGPPSSLRRVLDRAVRTTRQVEDLSGKSYSRPSRQTQRLAGLIIDGLPQAERVRLGQRVGQHPCFSRKIAPRRETGPNRSIMHVGGPSPRRRSQDDKIEGSGVAHQAKVVPAGRCGAEQQVCEFALRLPLGTAGSSVRAFLVPTPTASTRKADLIAAGRASSLNGAPAQTSPHHAVLMYPSRFESSCNASRPARCCSAAVRRPRSSGLWVGRARAFEDAAELAKVAGPSVGLQALERFGGETWRPTGPLCSALPCDDVVGNRRHVFTIRSLSGARSIVRNRRVSSGRIRPAASSSSRLLVRRHDHADIRGRRVRGLAALSRVRAGGQLSLQVVRQMLNGLDVQRASVRKVDLVQDVGISRVAPERVDVESGRKANSHR